MQDLFSLKGKVALVTGGSRGIGAMIARGYVEAGAKVYISARKEAECAQTAAELSAARHLHRDPGRSLDRGRLPAASPTRSPPARRRSHILVNNAGANWGAPLAEFPDSGWDKVLALNVKGVFHLTKFLVPLLEKGAQARRPRPRHQHRLDRRPARCRSSRPTPTRRARPPCTT